MLKEKLTPREIKICEKIMQGKSNKEISQELFISEKTVSTHIHNILQKVNIKSRYQIAMIWNGDKDTYNMYSKNRGQDL